MSDPKTKLKKFFIHFLSFYLVTMIACFFTTSGNVNLLELHGYRIVSALSFASVCLLWDYNYRNTFLALGFVGPWLGVALCKRGSGMVLSEREIVQTIEMSTIIYGICSTLFYATYYISVRKVFIFLRWVLLIFFSILLLLPLLGIGYYIVSDKHMLSANILLTLFQTNVEEVKSYLVEQNMFLWAIASFSILLMVIYLAQVMNNLKTKKNIYALFFQSVLIIALCIFCLPRLNTVYITNIYFRVVETLNEYTKFNELSENRQARIRELKNILLIENNAPQLHVLVIGEAAVRHHLSAFGYKRKTTPWLDDMYKLNSNIIIYPHAYSNNIQTVMALQLALTSQNQYSNKPLQDVHSLTEASSAADFETYWISNQMHFNAYDTPIATIANGADHQIFINDFVGRKLKTTYYDDALVKYFPKISQQEKIFIIFHLMGCHNVYSDRYPKDFKVFKGGKDEHVDEYDNCILYNDYVLSLLYKKAAESPNFMSFTYLSDHGEDPDNGLTHDYSKFTWNMAHIPFFTVFSDEYAKQHLDIINNLKSNKDKYWTSDLLYELMLDILGVKDLSLEGKRYNLSSKEYSMSASDLTIINGEKRLQDDKDL